MSCLLAGSPRLRVLKLCYFSDRNRSLEHLRFQMPVFWPEGRLRQPKAKPALPWVSVLECSSDLKGNAVKDFLISVFRIRVFRVIRGEFGAGAITCCVLWVPLAGASG